MRYAINIYDWLADLKNKELNPQGLLLRNIVNLESPEMVECEKTRIDGDSLLVGADITAGQWNAIVTLLRDKFERPKIRFRLYQSITGKGGWKRV